MNRLLALLLLAWWAGASLLDKSDWPIWFSHQAVVLLVALASLPALLRGGRVRLDLPVLATLLALLSLAIALSTHTDRFPAVERGWFALVGLAHALSFLLTLRYAPVVAAADDAAARSRERHWTRFLGCVFAALVLAQTLPIAQQWQAGDARVHGSFGNPNVLGATLAACAVGLAALLRWRGWAWVALAAGTGLVVQTRSRGALAAMVGALLLLALLRGGRRTVLALLIGLLLLAIVPNPLRERALALRPEDNYSRPFLWSCALTEIAEQPLGIGPGMNKHVFPLHALDPERPWLLHQRHAVGLTHNVLLTLTLEWGWLAGGAALALLAWALSLRLRRRPADPLRQAATLAALVLFLELQVDGLEQDPVAFSLFLFLAALALRRSCATPPTLARLPARAAGVALLLAALGLGAGMLERRAHGSATHVAHLARLAWQSGELDIVAARAAVVEAQERAQNTPGAHAHRLRLELAWLRREAGRGAPTAAWLPMAEEAWEAAVRAVRADPADSELRADQGALALFLYRRLDKNPALFERYRQAMLALLVRDPLDTEARLSLAREALSAGRWDLFAAQLATLFEVEPDHAFAWYVLGLHEKRRGHPEKALHALVRAKEAIFNARIKSGLPAPRASAAYERILARVDLERVRTLIAQLRRELYF